MANYSKATSKFKNDEKRRNGNGHSKSNRFNKRDVNMDRDSKISDHNDFSWYNKNSNLLSAAANLSYGNALGYPIAGSRDSKCIPTTFPGIMAFSVLPGPGVGETDISACNLAADNLYAFIRQANSGGKNYDPNDLMSYLLAFDELYMMYYYGVRAYGVLNLYNAQNRYAPIALLEAMGWDYTDVTANLARFKYAIQAFATRMNSFYVPGAWPYYKRHAWLYSNLFTDSTSPKAQLYLIKPLAYRVRDDETGNLVAGQYCEKVQYDEAEITRVYLGDMTVEKWINIMHEILNALTNSEDIGIIGGDIRKAFSSEQIIKFTDIPDTYTIIPVYDESVLTQFENATLYNGVANIDITMDNAINRGNVVYKPWVMYNGNTMFSYDNTKAFSFSLDNLSDAVPSCQTRLVNLHKDNPTVEDTVIATRLSSFTDPTSSTWKSFYQGSLVDNTFKHNFQENGDDAEVYLPVICCGAEIVGEAIIYQYGPVGEIITTVVSPFIDMQYGEYITANSCGTGYFKHHPITYHVSTDRSTALDCLVWSALPFTQIDTYATLDLNVCSNIHEACMLSLFNVPVM